MGEQAKTKRGSQQSVYQMLPVEDPSGGVDLRTSPTLLPADRARKLINFSLEEPGALVVRPGYVKFSTTSLGASRIQGGQRVYLNTAIPSAASTIFTLIGWNGSVYNLSDAGVWSGATLTGLSSTSEMHFPADRDMVAAFEGSSRIYKSTNGSSWTRFGIAPGLTAGSVSSAAFSNGLSTSEFELSFTYKDRDLAFESNGSTAVSTRTITSTANGQLNYVIPNSTDPQVDAIVVYARNKTSGETVLRKVSSLAQSGGANSTLAITSSGWTTNDEIPTDHTVPPQLSFGVIWKNRWWGRSATRTNRLHFTQLFQPQSWPALFYIDIPFERGDSIRALVPLGDALLIFGNTKIFVVIGRSSLDFEVRPTIGSLDGAYGHRAVAVIENGVAHASAGGVYIFDGTSDKLLSFDIDPAMRDLTNASANDIARVAMVSHQMRKELRMAVPRLYPTGVDGEWVLDLNRTRVNGNTAWTATDRAIGGYILWDGPEAVASNRGRLFSWGSTAAIVFEEATGTTANSSNMNASYEGPGLTLGAYRGRWPDIRGEYEPHAGTASIEPLIDDVSQGIQSINIGAGLSQYDVSLYDTAVYAGAGRRQWVKNLPLSADGRTFVLRLNYSGQEQFRMFSYHVGLVPESRSRGFNE
jgi:hypothetical protein